MQMLIAIMFWLGCSSSTFAQMINLSQYEKKVFSQNGEDGIIEQIFATIGTETKYYVEFGVQNGNESNTRFLREYCDWDGLLMDGGFSDESINLKKEFITAENINDLFYKYNVPVEFDLLSIDIDYNDFYVWHAIKLYSPRVIVIEYNATHLPDLDRVVIYNPNGQWDGSNYFGASIASYATLGEKKGYTLVYAESKGVNLFFIRNDILEKHSFLNAGCIHKLYKRPRYGHGPNGGHPQDLFNRPYITCEEACQF